MGQNQNWRYSLGILVEIHYYYLDLVEYLEGKGMGYLGNLNLNYSKNFLSFKLLKTQ